MHVFGYYDKEKHGVVYVGSVNGDGVSTPVPDCLIDNDRFLRFVLADLGEDGSDWDLKCLRYRYILEYGCEYNSFVERGDVCEF